MQTFYLNGFPYSAPDKIGYGIRLKSTSNLKKLYDAAKAEVDLESWVEQNEFEPEVQCAILESFLTPIGEAPPVKESFMEADSLEAQRALGFFMGIANPKTNAQTDTRKSGKGSSRRQTKK